MKRTLLAFCFILTGVSLFARPIVIKLASLAPQGSAWDISLHQMAEEWAEITDGEVEVKIYPGSIMGNEEDVIRKMRIGQVDAAVLTTMGMTQIVSDSFVFSLPFFIQTEEELDFVVTELTPMFDDEFRRQGFVVLTWAKSGWVYIFSNSPVASPEDLQPLKLGVSSAEPMMIQAFRSLGFTIVPAGLSGLMLALQSGMVEAFYAAPMGAASFQWFALAPNMLDMEIAPVLGGLVITQRTWNRIPRRYHAALLESVEQVRRDFSSETERMNQQALDIMLDNGLTVHQIPESVKRQWRNLFYLDNYSAIVGDDKTVDRDVYNEVLQELEDFRN
jgi:TRAP-type C4-dicarboxylate transport system substrate-binding protein